MVVANLYLCIKTFLINFYNYYSADDYQRSRHQSTSVGPSSRRAIRSSPLALPPSTSSRTIQDPR